MRPFKAGDIAITKEGDFIDVCWGASVADVPPKIHGVAVKITALFEKEGNKIAEAECDIGGTRFFQVENLVQIKQEEFHIGDKLVYVNRLAHDSLWSQTPRAEWYRGRLAGTTCELYRLDGDTQLMVEFSENERWSGNRANFVLHIPKSIEERVDKDIPGFKEFYPLLRFIGSEVEYEFVHKNADTALKILVGVTGNEVCLTFHDHVERFAIEGNVLKSYKAMLDKKNKRWAGIVSDKDEIMKSLSSWMDYWKSRHGYTMTAKRDHLANELTINNRQLDDAKSRLKDYNEAVEEWTELLTGHGYLASAHLTGFESKLFREFRHTEGESKELIKQIDFKTRKLEREIKRLKAMDENKGEFVEREYAGLRELIDGEILETIGVDKGMLYAVYSPLIMHGMKYNICPESGEENCETCNRGNGHYYLGRVRLEFHADKCEYRGMGTDHCQGFNAKFLSYREPTPAMHPHIRPRNECNGWCLHKYLNPLREMTIEGKMSPIVLLMRQFLSTYNNHHGLTGITECSHAKIVGGEKPKTVIDNSFDKRFLKKMYASVFESKKKLVGVA